MTVVNDSLSNKIEKCGQGTHPAMKNPFWLRNYNQCWWMDSCQCEERMLGICHRGQYLAFPFPQC